MIHLTLTPEELDLAVWAAERHTEKALRRGAAEPNYPNGTLDGNLAGNIRAAKSELAAAKVLGVYWQAINPLAEHDLAPDIEVKAVRDLGHRVVVRSGQTGRIVSAYTTTSAHDGRVTLRGWCYAAEAWRNGTPAPWGPESRLYEARYLRSLGSLVEAVAA